MAPVSKQYDYLVIGGGSGGLASARRASAMYGAKVGIIESGRLGGTCVNVGYASFLPSFHDRLHHLPASVNAPFVSDDGRCVPKKISWYAAAIAETLAEAKGYGFDIDVKGFDWPTFKTKRDKYIERLNGIYERNLRNDKVDYIAGRGRFVSRNEVEVTDSSGGKTTYGADKILIATGILSFSSPRNH